MVQKGLTPEEWAALQEQWAKEQAASTKPTEGTVEEIVTGTAGEFYGEKAKNPAEKAFKLVIKTKEGDEFGEAFSFPKGSASWKNDKFKLAKYVRQYGHSPQKGDKVVVVYNAQGYPRIAL